jgi:lipopolysaccharide export system protein LptA
MIRAISLAAFALLVAGPVEAQGTEIAFGGLKADTSQPVQVTADGLSVDQTDGNAVFTGNVVVTQGALKLTAAELHVEYATGADQKIERMHATGGVTLVNGTEAAQAQEAVYEVAAESVIMRGDVVLTQGKNAMSGQTLTVDLTTGKGRMEGRVTTILQPKKN